MENIFTTGTLFSILTSLLLVWYIHFHWSRRRLYELAALFNGPKTIPLIGNFLNLLTPTTEMIEVLLKASLEYKSPARMWFATRLAICVWNPEDLEIILNSPAALNKDHYLYKTFEPLLGLGVASLPVDQWKGRRRLLLPSFHITTIEKYLNIFCARADALVETLQSKVDKGLFDVYNDMIQCSLDAVLDTTLGLDATKKQLQQHQIPEWIHSMLESFTKKLTNILYFSEFIFNLSSTGKKFNQAKNSYHNYIDLMVQFFKGEIKRNRYAKENHGQEGGKHHLVSKMYLLKSISEYCILGDPKLHSLIHYLVKPRTFLEYLLYLDEDTDGKFSDEELRGEIQTILFAGLETSASELAFAFMILGMHPEVQERLLQEITEVLGSEGSLTCGKLKNLKYMERVIKEVMRIFPISVGVARESAEDIQLTNHILPAKTTILIGILPLHRDPNIWPNPTRFDPDRFLPEEAAKRHPYSYMPFSAGSRNCIGNVYAWMFMKIVLADIIKNFRIATCYKRIEDIHITMNLALTPTDGYKISLTKRN